MPAVGGRAILALDLAFSSPMRFGCGRRTCLIATFPGQQDHGWAPATKSAQRFRPWDI